MKEQKQQWGRVVADLRTRAVRSPRQASDQLAVLLDELREARAAAPDDRELTFIEARARFVRAILHTQEGRLQTADNIFRELLRDFELLEEPLEAASCMSALSLVAGRQNDQESSLHLMEQSFHLQRKHGASRYQLAHTLMNIGIKLAILDEREKALDTLQLAEEMFGEDDHVPNGIIQTNRALIYRALGDHDRCVAGLDSALALLEPTGSAESLSNALLERTSDDIRLGALPIAEARLQRAQDLVADAKLRTMEPECHLIAAQLWLAKGKPDKADTEIAAALLLATDEQRCRLLEFRAVVAEAAEDWPNALRWLRAFHTERLALSDASHQGRLVSVQARMAATIDEEQRNWLQAELQTAQAEARSLATRLQDQKSLLAVTAHDINNPLAIVLILGELATSTPESLHDSAAAIVEAALHMRSLVTKLIENVDQQNSSPDLSIRAVPMHDLLSAVEARYQPIAAAKDQVLHLKCEHGIGNVEGDRIAIERVLDNFLSNAIKYTPPGGCIDLCAQKQGTRIILEVLDTGPGLSPSDLERVFFYTQSLSAVPTRGESQHGLGLVSVRRLVVAMGGRVYAENRLRGGARFVAELVASVTAEHK